MFAQASARVSPRDMLRAALPKGAEIVRVGDRDTVDIMVQTREVVKKDPDTEVATTTRSALPNGWYAVEMHGSWGVTREQNLQDEIDKYDADLKTALNRTTRYTFAGIAAGLASGFGVMLMAKALISNVYLQLPVEMGAGFGVACLIAGGTLRYVFNHWLNPLWDGLDTLWRERVAPVE